MNATQELAAQAIYQIELVQKKGRGKVSDAIALAQVYATLAVATAIAEAVKR